jgi:hypothetical protein
MKRLVPLLVLVIALLVAAPAALAGGPSPCDPGGGHPGCPPAFGLVGTVSAVDAANGVLTVAVDRGCGGLSGTVDITVTADTRLFSAQCHERTPIALADITAGDRVAIRGTVDDSTGTPAYTARVVCVRVRSFGLVGSVTAVDAGSGVLSVAVDHGSGDLSGAVDVVVATGTELFSVQDHQRTPITLADIAVGDKVAAFGTIDVSTGAPVYTAKVVIDGVSAAWLPRPVCRPHDTHVSARRAGKGEKLKLHLRVADTMPGCTTAKVALTIKTAAGRTVVSRTVAGVAVNAQVTVSLKLGKALRHGSYRLVATSTDWAGNRQARAQTAVLTVK